MKQYGKYPAPHVMAELCLKKFNTLPKTGKPTANEWTVLAGMVLHNSATGNNVVVALGTGTKCIGRSKLCAKGLILNDSHAEVLARRALLRYLYRQLQKACEGSETNSIFEWHSTQLSFSLKEGLSFHFFSTQTPCGDACIEETQSQVDAPDDMPVKKLKLDNVAFTSKQEQLGSLLSTAAHDIYTGAKLLDTEHTDAMQQTLGAVRTKPGRGERTLSMSCSDKLAKWNVLGVQGALLDTVLAQPIYFATLNFCCNCKQDAAKRALYGRFLGRPYKSDKYKPQQPEIRICGETINFTHTQDEHKQPTPNGLVWSDVDAHLKPYEIAVNGKRQGVTAKQLHTPRAALKISKYELLKTYVELLRLQPQLRQKLQLAAAQLEKLSYAQFKQTAKDYQNAWSLTKNNYFQHWTEKPSELLKFSIALCEATKS